MISRRLLLKLAMVACCTLTLSGCWDNRDINHRSLPVVMGISREDSKYKVFLDIPQTSENGTRSMLVTRTGQTITQVVDEISSNMETRVDLLHLKVIIFDRKYAEEGLTDSISSFMRSREISAKAMVAICDEDLETFLPSSRRIHQRIKPCFTIFLKKMRVGARPSQ